MSKGATIPTRTPEEVKADVPPRPVSFAPSPDAKQQMWCCSRCGEKRQWGENVAKALDYKPVIKCNYCGRATRHFYIGIMHDGEFL